MSKSSKKDERKVVRFLACSDFHSDLDLVKRIEKEVDFSKVDFVLFGGDLSDEREDFSEMLAPFLKNKKKVLMVPGNHETRKGVKNLEKFYDVDLIGNSPLLFGGGRLAIFGTNYMEIGLSGRFEEEVFDNMKANFEAVSHADFKIQVNHIPPRGTEIGDASPFPFVKGSEPLAEFLNSEEFCPDVCLVGHIHETSGLEEKVNKTKLVNLANTFKLFEFDFEKKELKEIEK